MEPAPFSGFPVDIFKVPFTLLVRCQPLQILFGLFCGLQRVQLCQNMRILPDLFRRDAQQLPRIGADIIRLRCFGVQHQKYIVHIHRELLEQLLPIQNLGVLLPQVHAAPTQDQPDDICCDTGKDNALDNYGAYLQGIHVGIDNIGRDHSHRYPVLNARPFIQQVEFSPPAVTTLAPDCSC